MMKIINIITLIFLISGCYNNANVDCSEKIILIHNRSEPLVMISFDEYISLFMREQGVVLYSRDNCSRCNIAKNEVLIPFLTKKNISIYLIDLNEMTSEIKQLFDEFNKEKNIYYTKVPFIIAFNNGKLIASEGDYNKFKKFIEINCDY